VSPDPALVAGLVALEPDHWHPHIAVVVIAILEQELALSACLRPSRVDFANSLASRAQQPTV
jgi:hypothetical protein